ncbi:unnamed protein product [Rhizoctonia solani]|uniref:Stress-response A/B barrel domain-containing protein n=1 Tax=Rhizoctonia solani TaxID=456999 RepID=A0A8H3CU34_9AGAM|nr:unnamed protein product [Rhizoctonia solani]
MIIHFVLFKLLAKDEESKEKARSEIAEALSKVEVPVNDSILMHNRKVRSYLCNSVHHCSRIEPRDMTLPALFSRFKDRVALDKYAKDPLHLDVIENVIRPRAVLDETIDYDLHIPDDTW